MLNHIVNSEQAVALMTGNPVTFVAEIEQPPEGYELFFVATNGEWVYYDAMAPMEGEIPRPSLYPNIPYPLGEKVAVYEPNAEATDEEVWFDAEMRRKLICTARVVASDVIQRGKLRHDLDGCVVEQDGRWVQIVTIERSK